MSDILEIDHLFKKYTIVHEHQRNTTLKADLAHKLNQGIKRLLRKAPPTITSEDFWALQDVSFALQPGDRLGIIGRNGSGKSTLLKILSRITDPTQGTIRIRGRTASLLEVGTGFHPDLTGRENIFLNGAILGMSSNEIKKKFDEIVDFAETERFLDTPVKRYSSGMYTRLGFSIAAHLEPEILIVDEVLAVGDAQFQDKCFRKMSELSSKGLTIIFVSHHMNSILRVCNKGLLLNKGRMQCFGSITDCVSEYETKELISSRLWIGDEGDEHIRLNRLEMIPVDPTRDYCFQGEDLQIAMEYEVLKPMHQMTVGLALYTTKHNLLASSHTSDNLININKFNQRGKYRLKFNINTAKFFPGDYLIKADVIIPMLKQVVKDEASLNLKIFSTGEISLVDKSGHGFLGNDWCLENFQER